MHPPFSLGLSWLSESFFLLLLLIVTLVDRHHLDGSVVIGSLVIIRQSLWMTQVML